MAGSLDGARRREGGGRLSDTSGPRLALESDSDSLVRLSEAYLSEYLDKIRLACEGLGDEQLWDRPSAHSNSIGNLVLHLCGNLSLWLRATLGGRHYVRDRAREFSANGGVSGEEMMSELEEVVRDCREIVAALDSEALSRAHEVQGYRVSGIGVLLHAVEHMSYHTGQIVMMAKAIHDRSGERLEFYPHLRKEGLS